MLEIRKDYIQEKYVLYTVYDVINDNLIYDYFIETVDDAKKGNSFLKETFFNKWLDKQPYFSIASRRFKNDITEIICKLDKLIELNNSLSIVRVLNGSKQHYSYYQMMAELKEPKLRREFSIIVNEHCSHLNNNYSIKVSNNEHIEIKPKYSVFVEENNIQKQISLLEARNSIVPFFDALKSFNQSVIHGENRELTTFEGKKILLKFNAVEE